MDFSDIRDQNSDIWTIDKPKPPYASGVSGEKLNPPDLSFQNIVKEET